MGLLKRNLIFAEIRLICLHSKSCQTAIFARLQAQIRLVYAAETENWLMM